MAADISSSAPRTSPYTGEWEYDVFLCFRGDTRHGFTSHLLSALSDKQIRTFIDHKLAKTESIDELISILQRCALSVVVFSEKFADSEWCLEEVVTIAERMKKVGHRVLPVFYKVDPFDVTDEPRSYMATIDREYKARSSFLEDKKRWMDAVNAVANCAGHTSQAIKIESELIKAVVETVQKQLIDMSPSINRNNLVAMGSRIFEIERLLAMDKLDDTCIIGLWGMGGVGKTTLAEACYERVTSSNKGIKHLFVRNVNEICEKHHGVEKIVHKLYSKLLDENNIDREDLNIAYRRERLSRSRVFVVLDNVETLEQLEQLALGYVFNLSKVFAAGSRIIITTRNKKVLQNAMAKIYNVECLNNKESIRLFSLHAFKQDRPQDNWTDKSHLAISYCKGNPLALKILGGALFGEDVHYWRSLLTGLRQSGNLGIESILRRSYDKLGKEEKKIFMDVACLLYGMSRSRLIDYMATMYSSSYVRVKDLIDKSLLTCVPSENGEMIEVHDLLKEMAWNIVKEEPKLGKRSRLVDPDDVHKLLSTSEVKNWSTSIVNLFKGIVMVIPRRKRRKVTDMHERGYDPLEEHRTTEGICLDLSGTKEMYLKANAFEGMNSLTFLKFKSPELDYAQYPLKNVKTKIHLPYDGLNSLPEGLRWLQWDGYPSKSLPAKFYPQHLVHLIIRGSPIRRCWEGYDQPQLVNLIVLDLRYCTNLIAIPDISSSLNLEELLLFGCRSLVEVPFHVQYLTKLVTLDINVCKNLKRLPPKLDSKLLKHVRMQGLGITRCPEIDSRELEIFDLRFTSLGELPSAIYNVKQNGVLRLHGKNITKFPGITTILKLFTLSRTSIREIDLADYHQQHQTSDGLLLPRFQNLWLTGNRQLEVLPNSIWNMISEELYIGRSPLIESLPEISEPMSTLTSLHVFCCRSLTSIPTSISNLRSLRSLRLVETGIKSLPSSIHELRQLHSICLRDCKSLESIPNSIHKLSKLGTFSMSGCESIPSLPELPPNLKELEVRDCKSLQALPSNTCKLLYLNRIYFEECPQVDQTIPAEFMANFLVHASLSPSYERQVRCSGSELPKWFSYRSMEDEDCSTVKVELPLANDSPDHPMIKGIAFGCVNSSDPYYSWMRMGCRCEVGNTTVASWVSNEKVMGPEEKSSEKVWLVFNKNLSSTGSMGSEEDEAWYVKYGGFDVSFNFYFLDYDDEIIKKVKIKRCGVSLMY
uniref:Resistance-like protein P-B n=1 Tax=Linum usitatissimum TaxID=4006 RepID=Q9ATY7_LINUS|nr:resistance-like protein P-B [Linum usitatissimum]